MTTQHTPGPWTVEDFNRNYVDMSEKQICIFGQAHEVARTAIWDDLDTRYANARLIAAAPKLLGACQTVLHQILTPGRFSQQEAVDILESVIADATGN